MSISNTIMFSTKVFKLSFISTKAVGLLRFFYMLGNSFFYLIPITFLSGIIFSGMFRYCCDKKILNSIISSVSVYMVNYFRVFKGSADALFYYMAVLEHTLLTVVYSNIPSFTYHWLKSILSLSTRFKGLMVLPSGSVHRTQSSFYRNNLVAVLYSTFVSYHVSYFSTLPIGVKGVFQ